MWIKVDQLLHSLFLVFLKSTIIKAKVSADANEWTYSAHVSGIPKPNLSVLMEPKIILGGSQHVLVIKPSKSLCYYYLFCCFGPYSRFQKIYNIGGWQVNWCVKSSLFFFVRPHAKFQKIINYPVDAS